MAGLFDLLSVGARSLLTAQLAQATTGNNAANVSTPGFSRRRTTLVEMPTVDVAGTPVGMGVNAAGIARLRDGMLDAQYRLSSQDLEFAKAQAGVLEQVGAALSPADTASLATALNDFWAAMGDLAARPEDGAVRRTLLSQAQRLVDATHLLHDKLESLERDSFAQIADRVADVNDTAHRLATINVGIKAHPTDPSLADERDRLVDKLAGLIGVRCTIRDDGTAQVVVSGTGVQLVDGNRAGVATLTGTPVTGTVSLAVDSTAIVQPSGELGGLLRARNSPSDGLPFALAKLDALAAGVITQVNRVHTQGAGLTLAASATSTNAVSSPAALLNAAGLPVSPVAGAFNVGVFDAAGNMVSTASLAVNPATMTAAGLVAALSAVPGVTASLNAAGQLTVSATAPGNRIAFGADTSDTLVAFGLNGFFTGSDARTIGVDPALVANPSLIAAARVDLVTGIVRPGDGSNAIAMADLAGSRFLSSGTETPAEFLGGFGGSVGAATRAARNQADSLEQVTQAVDNQRQSVSGVNLDEELADMVRFQHAYEASAKFINTINEMMKTTLELI